MLKQRWIVLVGQNKFILPVTKYYGRKFLKPISKQFKI